MKLFSLSLIAALVVIAVPAEAATYHNAGNVDAKLSITKRLNDGTLLPAVRKAQTVTFYGVPFTSEPAVKKNMSHLRRLSVCSVTPEKCTGINTTWDNN